MEDASTVSLWVGESGLLTRPALQENITADVCIVGAGIAGLSTAYLLAREGRSVVVLDDGPIGGGMTGRTTAHLSNALDDRYIEIERLRGTDAARRCASSHSAAIERIAAIVAEAQIACGFERLDGYLFEAETGTDILQRELDAAHRAGLATVELRDHPRLGRCLVFPGQAQFQPLDYLRGLVRAVESGTTRIFCGSHVTEISGGENARVTTADGHTVLAGSAVVATNTPVNDRVVIHTKQAPYMTYAIAMSIPPGSIPPALYWDTADPYHYVRVARLAGGGEVLIVGGEDHKVGEASDGAARLIRLESWARQWFPMVENASYRWSGQVMESFDGLAFIGRNPADAANIYIATGDSGMGMTHSTIAAMAITDLIVGRDATWAEPYEPSRIIRAPLEFVKENLKVAAHYVKDYSSRAVASTDDIPPGAGALLRKGLSKLAVYKDEAGALHECSAVCPHLGCLVQWNDLEKTWDCPCHGSRFTRFGDVIVGPANRNLDGAKRSLRNTAAR